MGGLGLILLLAAYITLGVKLVIATRRASLILSGVVGLAFFAAPLIDAFLGRAALERICTDEGKVTVAKKVKDVEGIGVDYGVFEDSPKYYGYSYIEGGFAYGASWMLKRAEFSADRGEVIISKKVEPRSIYLLREGPRQDSFYFYRTRFSVYDRAAQEEMASFTWVAFRGGWAERIPMYFSGSGPGPVAQCGSSEARRIKTLAMLHETLQPKWPARSP